MSTITSLENIAFPCQLGLVPSTTATDGIILDTSTGLGHLDELCHRAIERNGLRGVYYISGMDANGNRVSYEFTVHPELSEYERAATISGLTEIVERLRCPPTHRTARALIYRQVSSALDIARLHWAKGIDVRLAQHGGAEDD